MKKIKLLSLVTMIFLSLPSVAQSQQEEVNILQSILGIEKRELYKNFLDLDTEKSSIFWVLYDEYEIERKELGQNRINLIGKYANNYHQLTPEKTDELMDDMLKQRKALDKLTKKYYMKMRKASGTKIAAQFLQMESYILSLIRLSIMENIPFIGEMDNPKIY